MCWTLWTSERRVGGARANQACRGPRWQEYASKAQKRGGSGGRAGRFWAMAFCALSLQCARTLKPPTARGENEGHAQEDASHERHAEEEQDGLCDRPEADVHRGTARDHLQRARGGGGVHGQLQAGRQLRPRPRGGRLAGSRRRTCRRAAWHKGGGLIPEGNAWLAGKAWASACAAHAEVAEAQAPDSRTHVQCRRPTLK